MTGATSPKHFDAVDGVRAVAILWVALYHYAVFWSSAGRGIDLLPYDDALAWVPLASVGDLGVSMFFVVSGFVIAFSLERCAGLRSFAALRLLRLWPTLLICGTLTFIATLWLGPEELRRSPIEYVISLAFLPPEHVGRALGLSDLNWLDGAYWSLWVEVRFYAVAGVLFFLRPSAFLGLWSTFTIGCALVQAGLGREHAIAGLLFTEYQPFFTIGIGLAAMRSKGVEPLPLALVSLGMVQAFFYGDPGLSNRIGLLLVCGLPVYAALRVSRIPVLAGSPLVRLGRASYAYYLLHQNLGLALLLALGTVSVWVGILAMLAVQVGLIFVSVVLTEWVEQPIRSALRRRIQAGVRRPAVSVAPR